MMTSAWNAATLSTASQLDVDSVLGVITDTGALAGDFTTLFAVGDLLKITGLTDVANEGKYIYVTALTATTIDFQGKGFADEVGDGDEILTKPEWMGIGQDQTSFHMEKNFLDLTDRTISYGGMLVDVMSMNFTYGELATGTFTFAGADYQTPAVPITNARVVDPADNAQPVNASSDVGMVIIDGIRTPFCIQSLGLELNNNNRAKECMGSLPPQGQTPGSSSVTVSMEAYLADENFQYMANKVDSSPIEILYFAENVDGGVAVHVKEAQLVFSDPASEGRDQDVTLSMEGVSRAPADGSSGLIIYWL